MSMCRWVMCYMLTCRWVDAHVGVFVGDVLNSGFCWIADRVGMLVVDDGDVVCVDHCVDLLVGEVLNADISLG